MKKIKQRIEQAGGKYFCNDNIEKYLTRKCDLCCDGKSALMTVDILNQIHKILILGQ